MEINDFIIEATKSISADVLKRNNFTKSYIGKVVSINGNKAVVTINLSDNKCILPVNMKRFINEGDTVVVQDLQNNKAYMVIHGVIKKGEMSNTIIHIFDTINNVVVSSVLEVWDELKNEVVSTTFVVD